MAQSVPRARLFGFFSAALDAVMCHWVWSGRCTKACNDCKINSKWNQSCTPVLRGIYVFHLSWWSLQTFRFNKLVINENSDLPLQAAWENSLRSALTPSFKGLGSLASIAVNVHIYCSYKKRGCFTFFFLYSCRLLPAMYPSSFNLHPVFIYLLFTARPLYRSV